VSSLDELGLIEEVDVDRGAIALRPAAIDAQRSRDRLHHLWGRERCFD
jgi:hypothetical protein